MSTLSDFSKLPQGEYDFTQPEKDTLLRKFEIPVQHLDFDYVEKCKDGTEIEKIHQILLSGEEGYFPQLIEATEKRLLEIKPKSKFLRKAAPVIDKNDLSKATLNELSQDIQDWVCEVSKNNKELQHRKSNTTKHDVEVRKWKELKEENTLNEKRITSTDYNAWDKYDPDTEILKMDIKEDVLKKQALVEETKKSKVRKSVTFNNFSTEAEANFVSSREREKGNEFFRAGDYDEALECYTNSIKSKSNVVNLNNRAITYIKLKKYESALNDAERALALDGNCVKSHLRKAQALEGLGRYSEVLECIDYVIQSEPNNGIAQELANRARSHCDVALKNTRMKIIEIE